jgi:crossover junction endodeoxyribonuclease RusA
MFRSFLVRGVPAPQGSKRAIVNRFTNKPALVESSKRVKPWRADVRAAAAECMGSVPPLVGPVSMTIAFIMPRPKGHYGSGRNSAVLKESAPRWPVGKPDLDKLLRAALDGMTGIVYADDAQIVQMQVGKRYPGPGDGPLNLGGMAVTFDA